MLSVLIWLGRIKVSQIKMAWHHRVVWMGCSSVRVTSSLWHYPDGPLCSWTERSAARDNKILVSEAGVFCSHSMTEHLI